MRAGNRGQAFRVEPDRSLRKDDLRTFLRRDKRADGSLDDRSHFHRVGDRFHSPFPARLASRRVPLNLIDGRDLRRSEEHTSELQALMRISYAVFCLKKKIKTIYLNHI